MSIAKRMIEKHKKEYFRLMESIQATDKKGGKLDFTEAIEKSCTLILKKLKQKGKVLFIGNGGSAAIASHMALDFWKNGKMRSLAFYDSTLITCMGNDYGYDQVFAKPIEFFADKKDILLAISSSGKSLNILNGAGMMNSIGGEVITLSGFSPKNPLRKLGSVNFYLDSGGYGFVEVIHQYICHFILDMLMQQRASKQI